MNKKTNYYKALVVLLFISNIVWCREENHSLIKDSTQQTDEKEQKGFSFGINLAPAGTVVMNIGTPYGDHNLRLGYIGGIIIQYFFNSKIGICSGLNYENKGYNIENSFNSSAFNPFPSYVSIDHNPINYMILPLTAKIRLSKNKNIPVYVNLGGYLGYALSYYYDGVQQANLTNYYNRYDYGIITGFAWMPKINERINFSLELRNNFGLRNIIAYPVHGEQILNESFALLVGLSFKI